MSERDNLDEELADEWQRIQARHMSDDGDKPEPAAEAETTDDAGDEAEGVPARDDKGRFASGKAEDEAATQPEAKADEAPAAEPEAQAEPTDDAPARDLNRPPSSWKPAAKAAWDALPPEIRAEVHRRESDWLQGQAQLLPDAELGRSMRQTIEPYRMLIEAEGGTPERAVSHLLQTAALFRVGTAEQKQAALAQIAQQYGIQMPGGAQQADPYAQAQGFRDPRVDQMLQQQEMARLQQEADQRRREEAETARLSSVVQTWSDAVDSAGKPLRPWFGNVEADLAALIPQVRASNPGMKAEDVLQQAYDRAVWAHPEIRPLLLKQQQDQMEAKRRADNQLRVQEAKKAASVNVPRRASVPAASTDSRGIDRMDEVIADTARELGLMN
jgi:hypothetical protein